MSRRGRVIGSVAGALGVAAAGTAAIGLLRQQRQISRRAGQEVPFGTLRSRTNSVFTDDNVRLHVEVDEVEEPDERAAARLFRRGRAATPPVTVVFVHGFCLNLDSWHFQRAAYRGLVRSVYFDHRSHGRSGHSDREHSTFEELGRDLLHVIDAVSPDGPVVLIGHSMGGMAIVAFAEQYPDLIGDRVVGVGLISTTAGGFDPSRLLLPMLPARLSGGLARRAVRGLQRGHRGVDVFRRLGASVATVVVDRYSFGGEVPKGYVEFVDEMLAATPFEVVAEFFPHFESLDKFDCVETLGRVPTSIICGTADKVTSIDHSRTLHERIPGSRLLECEGAGHMVMLECHDLVNAELDQLISAATAGTRSR